MKIIKRILLGKLSDSKNYIRHLRKIGILIGENCEIFSPLRTIIDEQNPHMLEIGNNVKITAGVTILTHDFSWCVTSGLEGHILGGVGKVKIGNNVFIGMNTTILKGSEIGNNVIIGANSVVSGKCDDNSVYAGIPAKKISSLGAYYEKRKNMQISEAREVVKQYYNRTGEMPNYEILREYLFLFKKNNENKSLLQEIINVSGHAQKCSDYYETSNPKFECIEDFIKSCNLEDEVKFENKE